MGCCLSSPTATDKSPPPNPPPHFQRSDDSRAPPPVDVETVKEVLSETPKPKPNLREHPLFQVREQPVFQVQEQHNNKTTTQEAVFEVKLDQIQEQQQQQQHKRVFFDQEPLEKWDNKRTTVFCAGEISEDASEICSLQSDSVSATTATRDDDDGEVQQRVVVNTNRLSPRKLQKNPREGSGPGRVVGKSPTRRTDSSPGRRYVNGVGSGRAAQPGQQPAGGRRVGLRAEPNRRDPGESSGRRSRSPATRITDNGGGSRANVSRSPSANRRYPGRTPVGPVEISNSSTRRIAEGPRMEEGKWAANESLDNPLVSLECFIFL